MVFYEQRNAQGELLFGSLVGFVRGASVEDRKLSDWDWEDQRLSACLSFVL